MQSNLGGKQGRSTKQNLRVLETQVKQSRIALQKLSLCLGQMSSQKISNLEQDLRLMIKRLNEQSVRKRLLEQITNLMIQKGEKDSSGADKCQIDRQLLRQKQKEKQVQDLKKSIDQIVSKNNEQINKIIKLKQQVSNLRTERVMYSNLFRNLQKQIKYFEQIYKNEVLVGEQWLKKKQTNNRCFFHKYKRSVEGKQQIQPKHQGQIQDKVYQLGKNPDHYTFGTPEIDVKEIVKKYYELSYEDSRRNTIQDRQLNSNFKSYNVFKPKQAQFQQLEKKKSIKLEKGEIINKKLSRFARETKMCSLGDSHLINKIEDCILRINRIKTLTETVNQDHRQIEQHFDTLQPQNEKVKQKIDFFQEQIDFYQNLIRSVDKKIENAQISQQEEEEDEENTSWIKPQLKITKLYYGQNESQIEYQNLVSIFDRIFTQLHIKVDQRQSSYEDQRCSKKLILLSEKIDALTKQSQKSIKKEQKKQEMIISQTLVCCLLQKMERFGNCESIYNKNQFQQEYLYQIGKTRKAKTKRMKTVPISNQSQSTS